MKQLITKVLSALKRFFLSISARLHVDAKVQVGTKDTETKNDRNDEDIAEKGD